MSTAPVDRRGDGHLVEEYGSTLEVFPVATDEQTLLELLTLVFERYWQSIFFGTLVQGAAWEVAAPNAPRRLGMLDGYLTVDFGRWHFHLCIGEHTASGPELGRIRRTHRAELYRGIRNGTPTTWGFRMFNGEDTQQCTILLPNPFLSDTQEILAEPQWHRLEAWDELRRRFLGLEPEPFDRTGQGFAHG